MPSRTEHGHVYWEDGSTEPATFRSMTFRELLVGRRPNPGYGDPWKLLEVDVIDGQLAVARVVIQSPRGYYIDLLTLRRVDGDGGWKIVSKQYSWHPGEQWRDGGPRPPGINTRDRAQVDPSTQDRPEAIRPVRSGS